MVKRPSIVFLALILVPALALSQDAGQQAPPPANADLEILAQSAKILSDPTLVLSPEEASAFQAQAGKTREEQQADLQAIQAQAAELASRPVEAAEMIAPGTDELARTLMAREARELGPELPPVRYRVFVSQSMPDAEVKALAQLTLDQPETVLVVRGLKRGQKFNDLLHWLLQIMGPLAPDAPVPSITIDPEQFTRLGIVQAPALARYDDAGKAEGFVFGVTSTNWLDARLDDGQRGPLGTFGPTSPVVEEDMISLLKGAAAQLDWKAMRDAAVAKFWKSNVPSFALPQVQNHRTRRIDPSFVVQETFALPNGQVIYRKGDRVNPLEQMDFNQVVVVFDPGAPAQYAVVREVLRRNEGRLVTVIASDLSTVGDFEGYGKLMERVGTRVYMLPDALRQQFHIEKVPTVVTADGPVFVVEEVPPAMIKEVAAHADPVTQHR